MNYSITFGDGNNTRNTWTNWSLVPQSPPDVPYPEPKTNYYEVPGRIQGPIDLSVIPFNKKMYERITGSWSFVILDDYWHTPDRKTTNEEIRKWLHGRITKMVREEDPNHFFYGRFTVTPAQTGQGPFVIQIGFDLEPVRYNLDGTLDSNWLSYAED